MIESPHFTENQTQWFSNFDNALVSTKDRILEHINRATKYDPFNGRETISNHAIINDVLTVLLFLRPIWNAAHYNYKAIEILERIKTIAVRSDEVLHHRATKQRQMNEDILVRCNDLLSAYRSQS